MKASFVGLLGLLGLALTTTACGETATPDSGSGGHDSGWNASDNGIPDGGSGTLDSGSGTPDSGSGILDSGSGTPDSGSGTPDSGIPDSGSGTLDSGSGTPDSGSGGTEYPITVRFARDCGFRGCGGNMVGNWRPQEVCLPPPELSTCPTAMVAADGVVRGHIVVTDTRIDDDVTITIRTTMTVPMSCLMGTTCDVVQGFLRMRYPDATCTTMGTNCQCTFSETTRHAYNGSYTTSGNYFTAGGITYEYCVNDRTFRFRRTSGTGGIPGLWTVIPR